MLTLLLNFSPKVADSRHWRPRSILGRMKLKMPAKILRRPMRLLNDLPSAPQANHRHSNLPCRVFNAFQAAPQRPLRRPHLPPREAFNLGLVPCPLRLSPLLETPIPRWRRRLTSRRVSQIHLPERRRLARLTNRASSIHRRDPTSSALSRHRRRRNPRCSLRNPFHPR